MEDSDGFDMATFHTHGPSGGQLPVPFHSQQAGLAGELLPQNEFPEGDSCTFIACFGSIALLPSEGEDKGCKLAHHCLPITDTKDANSSVWPAPILAEFGDVE